MLCSEYFKVYIFKSYLDVPVDTLKRFTKEHLIYVLSIQEGNLHTVPVNLNFCIMEFPSSIIFHPHKALTIEVSSTIVFKIQDL